jgi:hypothetical protein
MCGELVRKSYEYNYYIRLIFNKRSKQCVLAVPATRQHFSRQMAKGFRSKLLSIMPRSNQSEHSINPDLSKCFHNTLAI